MSRSTPGNLPATLTAATAMHIAPIFRANPVSVILHGTSENMLDQGTITFVSYRGHCFGITNQHVTQDFERVTAEKAFMLALRQHVPLPGRLIFTSTASDIDFPYDVSVFILNETAIRAGGKQPVPLIYASSPVVEGDKYVALGYPGHVRGRIGDKTSHPIYHITATCQSISDRKIVLQDELPPSIDIMRFGGISGGAIVECSTDDAYSLVGIIFEGRGQHEDVEDRTSATDIWVYGIPVTTTWMDRILSDAESRNVSLDVRPRQLKVNVVVDGDPDQ